MIRSGMFASERVARFLKQGGPEAVFAEVDRLQSDSSYLKRVYYSALLQQVELTPPLLTRLLDRVAKGITSDYEKATLLTQIAGENSITAEQRAAVARAVRGIGSDYEQRRVLTAVIARQPLSEAIAAAAIEAAGSIGSSYDRGVVLGALARSGAVTGSSSAAFMAAVSSARYWRNWPEPPRCLRRSRPTSSRPRVPSHPLTRKPKCCSSSFARPD
jgi:hypothetical protein